MDYEVRNNLLESENKLYKAELEARLDKIKKLEQERDYFKEQAILWRNDYKNEYEENRKLKDIEAELLKEKKELLDKVNQLEQRLDNKEKVNKQLREDIGKLVMNNPS